MIRDAGGANNGADYLARLRHGFTRLVSRLLARNGGLGAKAVPGAGPVGTSIPFCFVNVDVEYGRVRINVLRAEGTTR